MSDVSLLNSVYANVEAFSTLIDSVLERVEAPDNLQPGSEQTRLGQLLVDASDQGHASQSYEALVLDSLLRTPTAEPLVNLRKLGERLLKGTLDDNDRRQLEVLAKSLERERSEVAARLRGRR